MPVSSAVRLSPVLYHTGHFDLCGRALPAGGTAAEGGNQKTEIHRCEKYGGQHTGRACAGAYRADEVYYTGAETGTEPAGYEGLSSQVSAHAFPANFVGFSDKNFS